MNKETVGRAADENTKLARLCLRLIADIARRGATSPNPGQVGYALQELTQVLFERTGTEEIVFEPLEPSEIGDLQGLFVELDFVNGLAADMKARIRPLVN